MTTRWGLRSLGGAVAVIGITLAQDATAIATANSRNLPRCDRAILHDGITRTNRVNWSIVQCVRPLLDCAQNDRPSCALVPRACSDLADDIADEDRRLMQSVRNNCAGVDMSQLRARSATSCSASTFDGYLRCFLNTLHEGDGRLLRRLSPSACTLLAQVGALKGLPAEMCATDSACPATPPPSTDGVRYCGGPDAVACPTGFVCDRTDALCSNVEQPGRCVAATTTCSTDAPVCGCDGQTYASDCARRTAGVTKARNGACDPAPQACGATMSTQCPTGTYCDFSDSRDCGESSTGTCRPMRAEPCNLCSAFVSGPVCGCDYVTYSDMCALSAAGVSKWFDGACP